MENSAPESFLDRTIAFLVYLTAAVVPLVYYNNPIATEYFFDKAFFFTFLTYLGWVLFLIRALQRGRITLRWGETFFPLALFCLVALQSLAGASNFWKGWETIVRIGPGVPLMFLFFQVAGKREELRRMLIVIALANIGVTVYGFLQFYEVLPLPRDQYGTADPSTTIGLTNFVMEYMSVYMFVMPVMAFFERKHFAKFIFIAATVTQYYYFLISDNRAAMVGWAGSIPLAILLAFVILRKTRLAIPKSAFVGAGLVIAVAVAGLAVSPLGARFAARAQSIFSSQRDDAITFRLETWRQTLEIFAKNPLRGVGLANLEVVFPAYQSPFLENMTLKKNTRVTTVHNDYLQVLGDLGILGGIAFAWFLVCLFRLIVKSFRASHETGDLLLAAGLTLGVNAYLIMAFFAFPFEVPASAMSIFLVVGMLEVMTGRVLSDDMPRTWSLGGPSLTPIAGTMLAIVGTFWIYSSAWMWHALRAEVYFKESRIMKDYQQTDTAKQLLDDAIKLYPQNEAYYYDRSIFAIMEGNTSEAIRLLEMTAKLVPNYAVGRRQIGMMAAQTGDFEKAAREFEIAYKIYRTQHATYVPLLVNAYIELRQPDKALAAVQRVLDMGLKDKEFYYHKAQALVAGQKPDEAIVELNKALAGGEYPDARLLLGSVLLTKNQYEEALIQLDGAAGKVEGPEKIVSLQQSRARAFVGLKRIPEAKEAVQAALGASPNAMARMRKDPVLPTIPALQSLLGL